MHQLLKTDLVPRVPLRGSISASGGENDHVHSSFLLLTWPRSVPFVLCRWRHLYVLFVNYDGHK